MADHLEDTEFKNIPWCVKLMENPAFYPIPSPPRQPKSSTGDSLLAESLKTKDTISAWSSFCKTPAQAKSKIEEVRVLVSLGSGLNGYAHICHGGVIATLLDEATGLLLYMNRSDKEHDYDSGSKSAVTVRLNVTFLKAVATPQVVLVTASLEKVQRRKYYVGASIKDGYGVTLATADSLWVQVNPDKPKL